MNGKKYIEQDELGPGVQPGKMKSDSYDKFDRSKYTKGVGAIEIEKMDRKLSSVSNIAVIRTKQGAARDNSLIRNMNGSMQKPPDKEYYC